MNPTPHLFTAKTASLPDAFCWSKMGIESGQTLSVILRRKDHERLYGNGEVWWGVGESNLHRRIRELVGRASPNAPLVILTPQPTPSPKGNGKIVVWRDYLDQQQRRYKIPPHVFVISPATTGTGTPKHVHFALVFKCDAALTEVSGGLFYPNQWRNLGSEKDRFGPSQVTTAVERKTPVPLPYGNPYEIYVRGLLMNPFLAELVNPRPLDKEELARIDEAGMRTFSQEEWLDLVRSIRRDS